MGKNIAFNQFFTAEDISEPLASVASNEQWKIEDYFENKNYDVIGYEENDRVIGYLEIDKKYEFTNLRNTVNDFSISDLITNNTNLLDCLKLLKINTRLFVINKSQIVSIVTESDIQKPAVRMLFFGIITFFESKVAELIDEVYPDDEWVPLLNDGRIIAARKIYKGFVDKNQETNLISCTQICDKTELLYKSEELLKEYVDMSKTGAKSFFRSIEGFRNALAHAEPLTLWSEEKDIIELTDELIIITEKVINRKTATVTEV
ncbi:hypothetical protein ACFSFY_12465 [Sporosarcina siberiensis]|uniref:CBS domain-containing protein n=1 Tax=Sporosarcina siberiensis TaxID=1365606 RepID=A0ABW4SHD9_9BACL